MVKAGPCPSALYNERYEPTLTSAAQGAGLGLVICLQGAESLPSSSLPCLEILSYTLKCIQEISNKFFSVL